MTHYWRGSNSGKWACHVKSVEIDGRLIHVDIPSLDVVLVYTGTTPEKTSYELAVVLPSDEPISAHYDPEKALFKKQFDGPRAYEEGVEGLRDLEKRLEQGECQIILERDGSCHLNFPGKN
ncbi:hypothetical protein HY638_04890 [Candidatus Woesearchaeota archaeon]|nr:hypothetical protein [Candidatus Woesearchaeota archaeon]